MCVFTRNWNRWNLPTPTRSTASDQSGCEAGPEIRNASDHLPIRRQHLGRMSGGPERAAKGVGLLSGGRP
jgi:hypothetical protein